MPWFIPQIAVAGMFTSAVRALNKLIGPTLKETSSYKSWWAKAIMKVFSFAEGDINPVDPFSQIFFISDGLMNLMNNENKLKFAYHISEIASNEPDDKPVPEFFVENELRSWINQRFLLDPPLQPKTLNSFDDVSIPLSEPEKEDEDLVDDTKLIESVLKSYTKEKTVISEELQYHIDNRISLTENVFRYGSPKYFDVINEGRKLYNDGHNEWSEEEIELLESDRGKFFNYKGERLPFDFPMVNEQSFSWDGTYANEIDEAEYKGKDVSLNKPKSGGPKKWYVYVKNPKTGKVIKVSYGSPVMTAKWNDPGARKSFAARHQCAKKKDKTKAGYWACRAHKDFGKNVSGRFW